MSRDRNAQSSLRARPGKSSSPLPVAWVFSGWLPLVLMAACHGTAADKPKEAKTDEAPQGPLPRVRVEKAAVGPMDERVFLTGMIAAPPGRDVKLGALVAGRLAKVMVAEGDAVKAGQPLAEVEGGPAADELAQAEATAAEAEAAAQAAEARKERTDLLVKKGVAAAQEAEQGRADAVAARSARERARASVALARRKLSRSVLTAPFDGLIVAVLVRAGESVDGNGQPVLEIAAADPVEVRCPAIPKDAARLHVQMPAAVSVESLGLSRNGQVFAIAPSADPSSGNVMVRLRINNPDHALKLGVLARGAVTVGHSDSAIAVADSALVPGADGGLSVIRVESGVAQPTDVKVAFETDGRAVIASGLDAGDEVIIEGGYSLPEGAKVEVVR